MRGRGIKPCAHRGCGHYFRPLRRGCSSVVEHLLAKEDVASSSLVTRSMRHGRSGACRSQALADIDHVGETFRALVRLCRTLLGAEAGPDQRLPEARLDFGGPKRDPTAGGE